MPVTITKLELLKLDLQSWEQHDFEHSMSDDFWYSNGGHDAAVKEIGKIKRQIAELEAVAQ